MLDSLDLPVDDLLETIDREGDVDFLGSAVAGRAGRLVMGAQPKATAGLGLEVEAVECIDDQRRVARCRRICAKREAVSQVGLNTDRWCSRPRREGVRCGRWGVGTVRIVRGAYEYKKR